MMPPRPIATAVGATRRHKDPLRATRRHTTLTAPVPRTWASPADWTRHCSWDRETTPEVMNSTSRKHSRSKMSRVRECSTTRATIEIFSTPNTN